MSEQLSLTDLAKIITKEHTAGAKALNKALGHFRKAGEALNQAKAICPHGEWTPFLDSLNVPIRQAQRYMKFAKYDVKSFLDLEAAWDEVNGRKKEPDPVPTETDSHDEERKREEETEQEETPTEEGTQGDTPTDEKTPSRTSSTSETTSGASKRSGHVLDTPIRRERPSWPSLRCITRPRTEIHQHQLEDVYPAKEEDPAGDAYLLLKDWDVDVWKPDGTLLMAVRRGVIPGWICEQAYRALRRCPKPAGERSGRAGYKSTAIGYWKGKNRKDGLLSWNRKEKNQHRFQLARPFVRCLDEVFKFERPEEYNRQLDAVARTGSKHISGTAFTTLQVNLNAEFTAHRDKGNWGALAPISVLRAGPQEGGHLVFPKFGIGVDLQTRDVVIANVNELHAVSEILGEPDKFARVSVVAFVCGGLVS